MDNIYFYVFFRMRNSNYNEGNQFTGNGENQNEEFNNTVPIRLCRKFFTPGKSKECESAV